MQRTAEYRKDILNIYSNRVNQHLLKYKRAECDIGIWPYRIKIIKNMVGNTSGKRVLDLGCGIGTFALEFSEKNNITIGIDFCHEMLVAAKNISTNSKKESFFVRCDVNSTCFGSNIFDVIIASDIIEHLHEDVLNMCLKECYRILKAGGRLIIHTEPTRYSYLFYNKWTLPFLFPLFFLPNNMSKKIVEIFDKHLINNLYKLVYGKSRDEIVLTRPHCNPKTLKSLKTNMLRARFVIEMISHQNWYLVRGLKYNRKKQIVSKLFQHCDYSMPHIIAICKKNNYNEWVH